MNLEGHHPSVCKRVHAGSLPCDTGFHPAPGIPVPFPRCSVVVSSVCSPPVPGPDPIHGPHYHTVYNQERGQLSKSLHFLRLQHQLRTGHTYTAPQGQLLTSKVLSHPRVVMASRCPESTPTSRLSSTLILHQANDLFSI